MANPASARFSALLLLLLLVSLLVNIAAESPAPTPTTDLPPSSSPPSPTPASNPSPANSPPSPTPAPSHHSPPAPSPGNNPSPSPAPAPADDAHDGVNHAGMGGVDEKSSSSGGMSSGKKAGIALGVIISAGVVVLGALVYKRRRQNIQRSQYGYAARRELL